MEVRGSTLYRRGWCTRRGMCTLVDEVCVQTQRGIVGRGKMDVERVIEHEGHWTSYEKCTGWMNIRK